jgi:hypothetical protein
MCGILLMVAVALAKVNVDYNHTTDFSKYRSFSWMKEPKTRNPLMKDRIIEFINDELMKKDLKLVPAGGDLSIAAHTATREEHTLETFYNGFPGWRWHGGFSPTTVEVETYEVGTLIVDLFDTATKEVVWRGVASGTVSDNPDKNTKKLQDAVKDMFEKFPPKKSD